MKKLYYNYAESRSHGFDIHNLFQENQPENAKKCDIDIKRDPL